MNTNYFYSNILVSAKNKSFLNVYHTQIITYIDVIMSSDAFQNPSSYWTFLLIGNTIDSKVCRMMTNKLTGECPGGDNYQLFVKPWGQVLDEAEARMKYLQEVYISKRDRLVKEQELDEMMEKTLNNSAAAKDV